MPTVSLSVPYVPEMLRSFCAGEVAGTTAGDPGVEKVGCMIRFDLEVTINRPGETVFAFANDPATFQQWQPTVEESRLTSPGPIGVGATGVNVRKVMGQRVESTFEITSYSPNQSIVVKSTSGPVAYEITTSLEPVDGGTRLRLHFQGDPQGIFKAAEPFLASSTKRDFEEDYQRLKALLESR